MGTAEFGGATFSGTAWFDGATFSGTAWFDGATFSGTAWFDGATFSGDARFDEASGLETAELTGVRVAPVAAYVRRVWPPCWRVEVTADGWQTLRVVAAGGRRRSGGGRRSGAGRLT
ncbi:MULTISPECIES: pentapeptide repeat-containing protein [unclassified Nonomuraea]|uniref:pentapeptide repeat-containing protein n=1 Tax=unclassified Nonomuraea TaxID=2593643 RepID=UPI0033E12B4F